uniref:Arrestin C-terminal-like domain-containing protein n=1 Tax=Chromera velia CCMP2878 TaxID=1169474 RepID=A0A0G4IFT4_9ALVE|eukprot:Cvel_14139.t1-p1 / transcript=Cvel_14139.t1 / gene=Cvel_14139 / organism=Chromera_velia_CCMP2878 / gene_product=Arrestin domain-containing protein A, putative / transcript_product=Arrestin domain-containing protein A, putative / location=Cvel_scaffold996:34086-35762(-) / protein_length=559 / sequence_SO=supercontig / SO=protein_coding / is_pseudo=false
MGGSGSVNVGVRLHQQTYTAGDTVRGTVYCQCSQETAASQISLTFQGKESTYLEWTESRGTGKDRRTVTRSAEDYHLFLQLVCPVFSPPGGRLLPGQYEFPFQITLPPYLPSSLTWHKRYGDKASFWISYKVKANVISSNGRESTSSKLDFQVVARPRPQILGHTPSHFVEPDTQDVNAGCCINQGFMVLGAKSDCVQVQPGDIFSASVAFQNQSTTNIDSVDLVIKQQVEVRAGGRRNEDKEKVGKAQKPGLELGSATARLEKKKSHNSRELVTSTALQDLYKQLQSGNCPRLDVPLAPHTLHSYAGSLISVYHKVHVVLKTPTCIDDVKVKFPLHVCSISGQAPPPPLPTAPPPSTSTTPQPNALPPGWNPSVQPVVLDIDAATPSTAPTAPPSPAPHAGTRLSFPTGSAPPFSAPMQSHQTAVLEGFQWSLEGICRALRTSVDARGTTNRFVSDPRGRSVVVSLTPVSFGRMVGSISIPMDRPESAYNFGYVLRHEGKGFTSDHIVSAIANEEDMKVELVNKLAPLASDLPANKDRVLKHLSTFQQFLVEDVMQGV